MITHCKRKKKIIILVVIALGLAAAIWSVISMVRYWSVQINGDLSEAEGIRICEEFSLARGSDIEYIYSQGSDRYGVRVEIIGLTADYICEIINLEFDEQELYSFLSNNNNTYQQKISSGEEIYVYNLDWISKNTPDLWKVCAFELDDRYYIEIEKSDTDNIEIFRE